MIIAVDYDGTLEIDGQINLPLIEALKTAQRRGNTVILWTCREGKRLQEALRSLLGVGFRPNGVNNNAPETIRRFGYDPRKIYADVYIDDKGATGWTSPPKHGSGLLDA